MTLKHLLLTLIIALTAPSFLYLVFHLTWEKFMGPQSSGFALGLAIDPLEWALLFAIILLIIAGAWFIIRRRS